MNANIIIIGNDGGSMTLTDNEKRIMNELVKENELTIVDLMARTGLHYPSVQISVKNLFLKGYIRKVHIERLGRPIKVLLTARGKLYASLSDVNLKPSTGEV